MQKFLLNSLKFSFLIISLIVVLFFTYYLYIYYTIVYYTGTISIYIFFQKYNIDGLSLLLIYLTLILYLISLGTIWNITNRYCLLLFLITGLIFILIFLFIINNLLGFYILFEFSLVPVFLIIGIWGSRERRISAAYRFWLYTLFGSFFFIIVLCQIYIYIGSFNLDIIYAYYHDHLFLHKICWLFLFISFAIKFPIFPFHTWLPEAHTEAPTVGSILLAGIVLKIGPYGLIKFGNQLFILGLYNYRSILFLLGLFSIFYTSICALNQIDVKKIIAYSSISHMSFVLFGILSNNVDGLSGAILLLIAHGFISSGLFFLIGCIYDRYKTRNIFYYKMFRNINPILNLLFFFYILGNISMPGTFNFNTEIFIMLGIMRENDYLLIICSISLILNVLFNLLLIARLFFLPEIKLKQDDLGIYNIDLTFREIFLSIILLLPTFIGGFYINFLLNFIIDYTIYYLYYIYI